MRLFTAGNVECESCGTRVQFKLQAVEDGGARLNLVVQRTIGEFRGCTHLAWIEQVTDPAEFEELE